MIRGGKERLKIWLNKHVVWRGVRRQSDYRAVHQAQKIAFFGAVSGGMVDQTFTGDPALRGKRT